MQIVGPNPILVSFRLERDPVKGFSSVYTYEGSQLAIFGLATNVRADQKYVIDDSDKPLYKLIISSPDSGSPDPATDYVLEWELLGNDNERSIYDHPNSRYLGTAMLTAIKIAVKTVEDAETLDASATVTDEETNLTTLATGLGISAINSVKLFRLLIKGTTSYVTSQYVLRRTQTVSSRAQLEYTFSNVDKIHTSAQVFADGTMPQPVQFAIATIPAPISQAGYEWGWLKKTPSITQTAGGRFQGTQEWWLDQWSTFLYDTV